MTEELKRIYFTDPISKKTQQIRIQKSIILNAKSYPVPITFLKEDHAIVIYIDKNFNVRGIEATIFIQTKQEPHQTQEILKNKNTKIENIDIKTLNIHQEDETVSINEVNNALYMDSDKVEQILVNNIEKNENNLNIIIIGAPRVGKTSLIYRYIYNYFNNSYIISKDIKTFQHEVTNVLNKKIKTVFWDIPGQVEIKTLKKLKGKIDGIVCLFDVTNLESFNKLNNEILPVIKNDFSEISTIFIANKIDLANQRKIYLDEIQEFSKKNDVDVFESSILIPRNIVEPLNDIILSAYLKRSV